MVMSIHEQPDIPDIPTKSRARLGMEHQLVGVNNSKTEGILPKFVFLFFLAVGEYSSQNYHIPPLEKENHLQSRVLGRDMWSFPGEKGNLEKTWDPYDPYQP